MKTQTWFWIVMCAVGWTLIPCDISRGQDAAQESPAAPQQNLQPPTAKIDFTSRQTVPFQTTLSLEFATHGNPVGVEVAPVDAALRSQLNVVEGVGVVVTSIAPDSEAAKAGLKQFDIVLNIDGQSITGPEKFNELVGGEQGKKVNFSVMRQGKPLMVEVTLPKTPVYQLATVQRFVFDTAFIAETYRIGVTLADADDTLRSQLKLAAGEGLVVTDVVPDSPAAKAGIRRHDVLTKLDGKRLSTVEKINAQIQELKDRPASLAFLRGGEEKTCEVAAQLSEPVADPVRLLRSRTVRLDHLFAQHKLEEAKAQLELAKAAAKAAGEGGGADAGVGAGGPGGSLGAGGGVGDSVPLRAMESLLRWRTTATPTPAGDQIAALKKQLAEMQKSLEVLEASLKSPPAESPEKK